MFYVYVLKSTADGQLYVGSTDDLKRRVSEHNRGANRATKGRRPLALIYYEAYASEADARDRERKLKLRGRARQQLIKRINDSLKVE